MNAQQIKQPATSMWRGVVWHVTSLVNLPQILGQQQGLLSKTMLQQRQLGYKDISMEGVQQRRAERTIAGHCIHEFVPTFFVQRNPMMYIRRDIASELVWLVIDPTKLQMSNLITSNGNAAAINTRFVRGLEVNFPDWNVLTAHQWNDWNDGRRKRAAELLCFQHIDASSIIALEVCNSRLVLPLQEAYGLPVWHNPTAFFC